MSTGSMERPSRAEQIERLSNDTFDVIVLGGGITGIATAHELIRRGYKTALIDNHDFASGTSQESSQLIWGGIKYLENNEWKLVWDLCKERNDMVRDYPNQIRPLSFLYPHFDYDQHWLSTLYLGSWIYYVMGRNFARRPYFRSHKEILEIIPSMRSETFGHGFEYNDAQMVDSDARLSLDVLFDAVDAGLVAVNHTELTSVNRGQGGAEFGIEFHDNAGDLGTVHASCKWVVNACGVWVDEVNKQLDVSAPHKHLFSKGIHIIVDRVETHERACTFLAREQRPFFVLPWGNRTMIGTTDTPFDAPPQRVRADHSDFEYLQRECAEKFTFELDEKDVLNTKAGLRPLVRPANPDSGDFLALARSHKVWADPSACVSALWGGKYTSCFQMGKEIADTINVSPSGEPIQHIERNPDFRIIQDTIIDSDGGWTPDALEAVCQKEMVVKLEDLLRRRTNVGLKIENRGWGKNREHAPMMEKLAQAISKVRGGSATAQTIVDEYGDAPKLD